MNYSIKNEQRLSNILRTDCSLAIITGGLGVFFGIFWMMTMGIPYGAILIISFFHLLYGAYGVSLIRGKQLISNRVLILIYANAIWAIVSCVLFFYYFEMTSLFGKIILLLQIFIVAGLAILERFQLKKT